MFLYKCQVRLHLADEIRIRSRSTADKVLSKGQEGAGREVGLPWGSHLPSTSDSTPVRKAQISEGPLSSLPRTASDLVT